MKLARLSVTGVGDGRTVKLNGLDISDCVVGISHKQGTDSTPHFVTLELVVSELSVSDKPLDAELSEAEIRKVVRQELASILRYAA